MNALLRSTSAVVSAWACLASASPGAAQQNSALGEADSIALTRQLDEVYAGFREAYARLDAAAVANLYTADALYLDGEAKPRRGAAPIRKLFDEFFSSVRRDSARLELSFRILQRTMSPGLATDVGYYHLVRVRGAERGKPSVGRFVTILRKGADGRWRFAVDSYTDADPAEYEQAPAHEP
jgi:uncharacterized protein (TIGR02246 family)